MIYRYITIFLLFFSCSASYADWTTGAISDLFSGLFCVYPNSSSPNLNGKVITINLPSDSSAVNGWVNSGVSASHGKALFLQWNFNGALPQKYRVMYSAYGNNQAMYVAARKQDGTYAWLPGGVPTSSSTANGFSSQYQNQNILSIPSSYVTNMRVMSRSDFFTNGLSSPYAGTDPSIGNGFFPSAFDNNLVRVASSYCGVTNLTYTGANFNPTLSANILSVSVPINTVGEGTTGTYQSTLKLYLVHKSDVTNFQLLNFHTDDHVLIKINGHVIYWLGTYDNSNAPAKNSNPTGSMVNDIQYISGSRMQYLDASGNVLNTSNAEDYGVSETLSNPVNLQSYLQDGENDIDIKLIVGGGGCLDGQFQINMNCAGGGVVTIPSGTSYPGCNLSNISSSSSPCLFQNGAGVLINSASNSNLGKTELQQFVPYNNNYIVGFQAASTGNLSVGYPSLATSNISLYGDYFFEVEVGPPGDLYIDSKPQLVYKICPTTGSCSSASQVYVSDQNYKADAYQDGTLFFTIANTGNAQMQGVAQIKVQSYSGTTIYSDFIFNNVVLPIQTSLANNSRILYQNAILNPFTTNIYISLMTLYILLYGLYFLLGVTQIKLEDIIIRILKIVVLSQLFSASSWTFFNKYFFSLFTQGLTYLIYSVTGLTSSTSNVFGFIDPLMDKFSNPQFWGAIAAQIASIQNGLTVIGIISLVSVFTFLLGAFDIIIGYLLAVMGLSVMICMAPLFMVFILFKPTRSLFDNWVSVLFSNTIQPSIALLLFLVVDQMFQTYISRSVLNACMGLYIPVKVHLDFSWIHSGWNISVPLPFFPGFPFLIPDGNGSADLLTSSLMAFVFGKVSMSLTDFSAQVSSQLSSVMPAKQGGKNQQASNLISGIKGDIMGKRV